MQAAAAALEADPGRLDVLVNNAATYVDWTETATRADLAVAHQVLEVNLFGAWRLAIALLPLLRQSAHPRIVNVSSGAGSHGDNQFGLAKRGGTAASYGISKAALNALTSTLAAELADTPILVNAVCPGLTATWPGAEAMGARPVTEGAASVLWAATLPDDGPHRRTPPRRAAVGLVTPLSLLAPLGAGRPSRVRAGGARRCGGRGRRGRDSGQPPAVGRG